MLQMSLCLCACLPLNSFAQARQGMGSSPAAIEYKGVHLGYVPRERNALLAQPLFFGHGGVVRCKVVQRDKKAHPREQVRVKLYLKDKR